MIGLDTNVLVRFLTHDDSTQTAVVTKLLASLSPDSPGYVSLVVLVELIWVLDSFYRFKRNEIGDVIETLLRAREIVLEHPEIVEQALRKFKTGNADFADFIIDRAAHAAGCDYTLTFDRKAVSAGMRLLQ
jgi:predicted nucleic-acid-binding protein